jgi:hypothetical protein
MMVSMSRHSWRGSPVHSKIHVFADRSNWPTVDQCAIAGGGGTADRSRLRERERTDDSEYGC